MGRAVVRLAHAEGVEIVCAVGSTDIGRDPGTDLAVIKVDATGLTLSLIHI